MMSYFLDVYLCGLVLLAEIAGATMLMLLIQLIFYRGFKINLYKNIWRFLNRMDQKVSKIFG